MAESLYDDIDFDENIYVDETLNDIVPDEKIIVTEDDLHMADECDEMIEESSLDIVFICDSNIEVVHVEKTPPSTTTTTSCNNSKTFSCSICGKVYKTNSYRKEHEKKCSKYIISLSTYIIQNEIIIYDFSFVDSVQAIS